MLFYFEKNKPQHLSSLFLGVCVCVWGGSAENHRTPRGSSCRPTPWASRSTGARTGRVVQGGHAQISPGKQIGQEAKGGQWGASQGPALRAGALGGPAWWVLHSLFDLKQLKQGNALPSASPEGLGLTEGGLLTAHSSPGKGLCLAPSPGCGDTSGGEGSWVSAGEASLPVPSQKAPLALRRPPSSNFTKTPALGQG